MNKFIRSLWIVLVLLFVASPVLAQESEAVVIAKDDLYFVLSLGGFLLGLIALVVVGISKRQSPQQLDQSVAQRLEAEQRNREHIERLERAYQANAATLRPLIDAAALGLRFIAPLTPMKTDDAAANLLADIQTPGQPADPPKAEY